MYRNCLKIFLITAFILGMISMAKAQVVLKKIANKWELTVDEKPFKVKGVTFGYTHEVEKYDDYFKDLQFLGVNTIRIWATDENTQKLLDTANKYGIKVMVGIWMRHGRPGMEDDDRFDYLNDGEGKEKMFQNALKVVKKYQHHPAVLTWGIGNEVYLNIATDEEKKAYSELLEKICKTIKKTDTQHPITSVEAWTFGLDWWQKYVPSIDIYGLNSYGEGANYLSKELQKRNIDKPYIVTEFGVTGEWGINKKKNTIKIEPTDEQKYDAIVNGYHNWIENKPSCLGVYVFNYNSGDDFISIWLNTHFNKRYRPQYWAIREAFTNKKPVNNVPKIKKFEITQTNQKSGNWIPVDLEVFDFENDTLSFQFYYNQRTGSRKRRNQVLPLLFKGNATNGFQIRLPKEDGAIKIYATAGDSHKNIGIASTSTVIIDEEAKKRKYLVPKAVFPFYVYQDNLKKMPYLPSNYMGNYKAIEVNTANKEDVHSGNSSIKITYKARDNWYGIAFVNPANDWGDILGGYDLSGAKTLHFWAKSDQKKLKATVGFGLIDSDKPFPDTAKKSTEITLSPKWKKYSLKTKDLDLSCIRSGFVIFSNGNGFPHAIYLDDIVFE